MRTLYRWASTIAYPFIWLWLKHRATKGKEDASRLRERIGFTTLSRPQGQLIWIHAASVGESNSVMPLIRWLHDADESIHIVLTTGTVSSANVIAKRLPERAYHQFVPIDVPFVVQRFLKRLQPDAAVWVESELWPNLLQKTKQTNIPIYLVNARISERSASRWRVMRQHFLQLMQCFEALYAGSQQDKQRLHHLGVSHVEYVGNLKYDAQPPVSDPKQTGEILANIGDRRVWLASSTHPGEEEMVATIHRELRETFPDLLTILVPRHPHRSDEICDLLKREKLTAALRSKKQIILPETDVYLADTMGELGIFYRLTGVVFMGGSLVPHGGHNPIEPAQLDCAILCGPHMENFSNIVAELSSQQAIISVADSGELMEQVNELLRDYDKQEAYAQRAHDAVDRECGATQVIGDTILTKLGLKTESDSQQKEEEAAS